MTYLIDSDVVADWLQGRSEAIKLLSSLRTDGLAISLITYGEIYEGIYYGQDPQRSEQVFRHFLRGVDVLPLNRTMMRTFAQVRGDLRRHGQILNDPDLFIAATALFHDLILISGNVRHFQRVPNLRLYDRSEGYDQFVSGSSGR